MTSHTAIQRERLIETMIHSMETDPSILMDALSRQFARNCGDSTVSQACLRLYDTMNRAKQCQQAWRGVLLEKFQAGMVTEAGPYTLSVTESNRCAFTQRNVGEVIGAAQLDDLLRRLPRTMTSYLHIKCQKGNRYRPK